MDFRESEEQLMIRDMVRKFVEAEVKPAAMHYDHQTDPQENENIAKRPENAALVEQLMAQWKAGWRGALPAKG